MLEDHNFSKFRAICWSLATAEKKAALLDKLFTRSVRRSGRIAHWLCNEFGKLLQLELRLQLRRRRFSTLHCGLFLYSFSDSGLQLLFLLIEFFVLLLVVVLFLLHRCKLFLVLLNRLFACFLIFFGWELRATLTPLLFFSGNFLNGLGSALLYHLSDLLSHSLKLLGGLEGTVLILHNLAYRPHGIERVVW